MRIASETRIQRSKVERAFPIRYSPKLFGLIAALASTRSSRAGDRVLATADLPSFQRLKYTKMDANVNPPGVMQSSWNVLL